MGRRNHSAFLSGGDTNAVNPANTQRGNASSGYKAQKPMEEDKADGKERGSEQAEGHEDDDAQRGAGRGSGGRGNGGGSGKGGGRGASSGRGAGKKQVSDVEKAMRKKTSALCTEVKKSKLSLSDAMVQRCWKHEPGNL